MVLVAMLAAAVGGMLARQVYAEPDPGSPAAVVPGPTAVPPREQPGDTTVRPTQEAAAHPLYEPIRHALQTHFDAINARDYARWRTVVSERRVVNAPEPVWREDYRSTRDGSIAIWRIESGPANRARVLLSFTSTQDPADAPIELPEACINWWVVWPFVVEKGAWKVDAGLTNSAPQHKKC
jgi:hypothetical protein